MKVKVKKPFYKKWWVWVIVVFVVIGASTAAVGGDTTPATNADKDRDAIQAKYNKLDVTGKSYTQVKGMIIKVDKFASLKEKNSAGGTIHAPKAKVTEIKYHKILDYVEVFTDVKPEAKASSSMSSAAKSSEDATSENIDPKQKQLDYELSKVGGGLSVAKGADLTQFSDEPEQSVELTGEGNVIVLLGANQLPSQKKFYKDPQYWTDILNEAANDVNAVYGTTNVTFKAYDVWTNTYLIYRAGEDF